MADVEQFEALLDRELPDRRGRKLVLEWRAACRHVGFLVRQGALGLPVTVSKRESPDFELRSGLQTILLEVTEATPPRYRALEASAGGDQPDGSVMIELDPELLGPSSGKPRRGDERFIVRSGGSLSGDGSAGLMPERQWLELVVNALKQKQKKSYFLPTGAVLHLFIVGEPIFPGVKDNVFKKAQLRAEVCNKLESVGGESFKLVVIDLTRELYKS